MFISLRHWPRFYFETNFAPHPKKGETLLPTCCTDGVFSAPLKASCAARALQHQHLGNGQRPRRQVSEGGVHHRRWPHSSPQVAALAPTLLFFSPRADRTYLFSPQICFYEFSLFKVMTSCSSPQAQGGHLPLRLLGGRVVSGSHPAHLQVRLHRVLRLQLQHRPGGSLRPAARLPPGALTPGHSERRDFTRFSMTFMMLVKSGDFGNVFFFFLNVYFVYRGQS